ncbi:hypothetical protein DFH09DRAFT_1071318 [Mycena vulgaris]|nr:hypothetical protein DFH09DRAFT_1071318 [Mycena vulgaris]
MGTLQISCLLGASNLLLMLCQPRPFRDVDDHLLAIEQASPKWHCNSPWDLLPAIAAPIPASPSYIVASVFPPFLPLTVHIPHVLEELLDTLPTIRAAPGSPVSLLAIMDTEMDYIY